MALCINLHDAQRACVFLSFLLFVQVKSKPKLFIHCALQFKKHLSILLPAVWTILKFGVLTPTAGTEKKHVHRKTTVFVVWAVRLHLSTLKQ